MLPNRHEKECVSPLTILSVIRLIIISVLMVIEGPWGVYKAAGTESIESKQSDSLTAIEASLERADWEKLASTLTSSPEPESLVCKREPTLRFLAGHALLATNRNNEATLCFACADDTAGSATLKNWYKWTKNLVRQHPNWSTVRYLYADALARLGLFEEAAFELDQVLAVNPQNYLARNARGVVNWVMGVQDTTMLPLQDSAIMDFQIAAQQTGFADAWANLGVLDLYQGYNPENAKENFEQALGRDSSFALAVNGRACAFGALGDLKHAQKDIARAKRLCSSVAFVAQNAVAAAESAITTSAKGKSEYKHQHGTARGFEFSISAHYDLLGIGGALSWKTPRGGIYVQLKEGENLLIDKEGEPKVIGTWFVLNYPLLKPQATPQRSESK